MSIKKAFFKLLDIQRENGPVTALKVIKNTAWFYKNQFDKRNDYQKWILMNLPTQEDLKKQKNLQKAFKHRPLISVITPVYDTKGKWLKACIESVDKQTYDNWELILINDNSTAEETMEVLKNIDSSKIKIIDLKKNVGIAAATQKGLEKSRGEFIALLDSDDVLSPDALYENVSLLKSHAEADFIYSDEDKISPDGLLMEPFFKPDWSYHLLLSMMYTNHFTVYRRSLVEKAGGFKKQYDGSQDYDMALRMSELTQNIFHIPKVLYHWRVSPNSAAFKGDAKKYALGNAKKAIQDHLKRKKVKAKVEEGIGPGKWRIRYEIKELPKVTIVILTGGKLDLLRNCINSIYGKTTYSNYEILVADNSFNRDVSLYLQTAKKAHKNFRFYKDTTKPFNYSLMTNNAVKKIKSPYVLLLNDDTEIDTGSWIEEMIQYAQMENVGAVGCKLLFPNRTIQHAGVIMGVHENTAHAFKGVPEDVHHYFDLHQVVHEVSAVTFACVLMRTNEYKKIGGLDEVNFKVAFNDTDLCLKFREKGKLIIFTPFAVLKHYESVTKKVFYNEGEVENMQRKWKDAINNDPYYNPNLSRKTEDYTVGI